MRKTGLVVAALLLVSSLGHLLVADAPEGPALARANSPPTAVISEPRNGAVIMVGAPTLFDGSNSTDPDNDTLRYRWQFGDGEQALTAKATHVYTQPGLRLVNLTVNDSKAEDKATIFVNIVPVPNPGAVNVPPKAAISGNQTGYTGVPVYFSSLSTDPNNDNLSYSWNFGESQIVNFFRPDAAGKTVQWTYNASGNYTVTHWVQETNTTEHYISPPATAWANITDLPVFPPLVNAGPPITAQVNTEATLSGSAAAQNPDGKITSYQWDFDGDGTYDWSSNTTGKAKHTYTVVQTYVARLKVTDNKGLTAEDTTNVTVTARPNIPPVANAGDDQASFVGQAVAFRGTASDEDGQVVRYQWDYDGDGVWDYESPSSGTGSWTFQGPGTFEAKFRVTDDRGATAEDTAAVTVKVNLPPEANAGGDQTVNCGEVVQFDGSASKDPEGGKLTFSWDFDDRDGVSAEATGPVVDHVYDKGGEYTATLTVTDDMSKRSTDTALITVVQTAGVSVAVNPRTKSLRSGEEGVFTITIQNSGNGKDGFDLFLSGDNYRWGTLDSPEVTIEGGSSTLLTLRVTPPVDSAAGTQAKMTITAASTFDQNSRATAQVTVTVLQGFGLTVSTDRPKISVEAGRSVTFTLQVSNTGNGDDRVMFKASGAAGKWATLTPAQAVISKGNSRAVTVKLGPPSGASAQDYILTLTAMSGDNSTQSSVGVTVTVKASSGPGFIPGFGAAALLGAVAAMGARTVLRRRWAS